MARNIGIGSLACYDGLEQVGEGTYGYVFRARDKRNDEIVALKRLIIHKETSGFPMCAVREIKFLKCLSHKNIVKLKDIATSKGCGHLDVTNSLNPTKANAAVAAAAVAVSSSGDQERNKEKEKYTQATQAHDLGTSHLKRCGNLYFVFEYIEHDIGGLIDAKYKFSLRSIKCIMKQLFEVLDFLMEKKVLHRDIKSSNILISNRHQVKLADFGLARSSTSYDGRECDEMTNNVITMWYKPPELLLGAKRYSYEVDMWSVGCVLAELELGKPLFPGKTDVEQLDLICKCIGTPTEEIWPSMVSLPNYESAFKNLPKFNQTLKSSYSGKLSEGVVQLLERILVHDPNGRTSPRLAMLNKFFSTPPFAPPDPSDLDPLALPPGTSLHEYQTKQKRRQREEELRKTADLVDQQITQDPNTGHLSTVGESRISSHPGLSTSTTATSSANSLPNNPFTQQLPPYPLQTLQQRPLSIPLPPALYASSASSNSYMTSTNDNSIYNGIYHTSVLKQQNIPVPSTGSNPTHSMRSQHQVQPQPQQDVTHRQSHQSREGPTSSVISGYGGSVSTHLSSSHQRNNFLESSSSSFPNRGYVSSSSKGEGGGRLDNSYVGKDNSRVSLKGEIRAGRDDYVNTIGRGSDLRGDSEGVSYRGARNGNDDQNDAYGDYRYSGNSNSNHNTYGPGSVQGPGNGRLQNRDNYNHQQQLQYQNHQTQQYQHQQHSQYSNAHHRFNSRKRGFDDGPP